MKNPHQPPLAELGEFVVVFQAVEAEVTDMIEFVVDGDPEYTHALAAELEFSSKLRALDAIYTRSGWMNQVTDQSPHPEFHKPMSDLLDLAKRRNEIVRSFDNLPITVDGTMGLTRRPTRLRPSKGERHDPPEDILLGTIAEEAQAMRKQLERLAKFRHIVLETRYHSSD